MLLQRMINHVKDQDWFAVVLEFVIVVISIAAAFQLQSWGENRAAHLRAQQSIHQLYEESEEALQFWTETVKYADSKLEIQDQVIAALSAGDRRDLTADEIADALTSLSFYPALAVPRHTYDGLSSAGLLSEIDAPEAMAQLTEYYVSVDFVQGQIGHFRPNGTEYYWEPAAGVKSVYDPTNPTRRRKVFEFDTLAADPRYVNNVIDALRNQLVFEFIRRGALHRAADACRALAAAVGKPCEAYAAYEEVSELPEWLMRDVPPREDEGGGN